jgi:hypothetical protein
MLGGKLLVYRNNPFGDVAFWPTPHRNNADAFRAMEGCTAQSGPDAFDPTVTSTPISG